MTTSEVGFLTSAATSGVDVLFLLELGIKAAIFVALCSFLAPYLPIVGKVIELFTASVTALEKAVPKLKEKKWWAQTRTIAEFIDTVTDLVSMAEPMKDDDPEGKKRNARVKDGIRKLWGINHAWDDEQHQAVDEIIDIAINRLGNLGKLMKKSEAVPFRPEGSVDPNSKV